MRYVTDLNQYYILNFIHLEKQPRRIQLIHLDLLIVHSLNDEEIKMKDSINLFIVNLTSRQVIFH